MRGVSSRKLANFLGFACLIALFALTSAPAQAQSACRFLSGKARTLCMDASAHPAANTKKTAETPAPSTSVAQAGISSEAPASAPSLGAQSAASSRVQSCGGLEVTLVSLTRIGPGDVAGDFLLKNTNNDDMAVFVYYGGAGGHNTFLVDDSGTEWPKQRGGEGSSRKRLLAGVKTKYKLFFHVTSGGQDARTFAMIAEFQKLPATGMAGPGTSGWCAIRFNNVPLSTEPAAE